MVLDDALLFIDSYPDPTPRAAIDASIAFVAAVGGRLTALTVEMDVKIPSNRLAEHPVGLPLLKQAGSIRVFTVLGDKPQTRAGLTSEVARHLRDHGLDPEVEEIDAAGRAIGRAFDDYLDEHRIGLTVMGAYVHSRMREFILGGATRHMLEHRRGPAVLSH